VGKYAFPEKKEHTGLVDNPVILVALGISLMQ